MKTGLIILLLLWGACKSDFLSAQPCFRVVSYNVENFFDCNDDSLKQDDSFTPEGENRWTPYRYWKKQQALSKVIAAFSSERLPDVVGLCEVENDSVLSDFTRRSPLRVLGYNYVITKSPDMRGINVALLYQPGSFKLLNWHAVRVPSSEYGLRPTRDILYVAGQLQNGDTLHTIVCHFPSRAGQTRQANKHRILAAETLRHILDSIQSFVSQPRIVVMGDFNAVVSDKIFSKILGGRPFGVDTNKAVTGNVPGCLFSLNLNETEHKDIRGSYRYRGIWEHIDHILVSPVFLSDKESRYSVEPDSYRVAAFPFLYESEQTYGGVKPFRTYQGPFYKGGYSDHFPVVLDFICEDGK